MTAAGFLSLGQAPELRPALESLYQRGWPVFMSADVVEERWWSRLLDAAPDLQLAMVEEGVVVASAHATPLDWQPDAPLPDAGWDWALEAGAQLAESQRPVPAACALAITVEASRRG